jgi:hypothetical protein
VHEALQGAHAEKLPPVQAGSHGRRQTILLILINLRS